MPDPGVAGALAGLGVERGDRVRVLDNLSTGLESNLDAFTDFFDEIGRHLGQKSGRFGDLLIHIPEVPPEACGTQVQLMLGARHTDIKEAALVFDLIFVWHRYIRYSREGQYLRDRSSSVGEAPSPAAPALTTAATT